MGQVKCHGHLTRHIKTFSKIKSINDSATDLCNVRETQQLCLVVDRKRFN